MNARVFIGHRPGDAAGAATALAGELDAMFGDGQVVRIDADAAVGGTLARGPGRNAGRHARSSSPSSLPSRPGRRCCAGRRRRCAPSSRPASTAGALILPLLGEGVADLAPQRRPAAAVRAPLGTCRASRCATPSGPATSPGSPKACAGWACVRWSATQPGTMPLPLHDEGPIDDADACRRRRIHAQKAGRRRQQPQIFGMVAVGLLVAGGWGVWRWRQRRAANLSGIWRGQIGLRGAPTSREGGLMRVTVTQKDRTARPLEHRRHRDRPAVESRARSLEGTHRQRLEAGDLPRRRRVHRRGRERRDSRRARRRASPPRRLSRRSQRSSRNAPGGSTRRAACAGS